MPKKFTLFDCQQIAKTKGGKCLSTNYKNTKSELKWECSKGHTWFAPLGNIKDKRRSTWCPKCRSRQPNTIEEMHEIAKVRGGKCLSREYINPGTHLRWQCSEGHRWTASPRNVKYNKTWCPTCAGSDTLTLDEMKDLARDKGGRCLSQVYLNGTTSLEWECSEGHRWFAIPNSVKRGSWCAVCSGNVVLEITEIQQLAVSRGGRLVSEEYKNAHALLEWECSEGHRWFAKLTNVKHSSQWCPHCKVNTSEEVCRTALEQLTGKKFPRLRPEWMSTGGSGRLELDGFCSELRIAFEYHGKQHFENVPFFHKGKNTLKNQKRRDELKKKLCKNNRIVLLEFTYLDDLTDITKVVKEKIEFFPDIKSKFDFNISIDLSEIWGNETKIDRWKKIAEERGGRCLSDVYFDSRTHLNWECFLGHRWSAKPDNILQGHWCPQCRGKKPTIIDVIK